MITPPAPITQPTNDSLISEVEASNQLMQNDYQQVVKEVFLRHLIEGSIKDNEALRVTTGVSIVDLSTNRTIINHNQDTEQFAASINKLPVGLLLLEDLRSGKLSLDQTLTWTADDRRDGFGDYDKLGSPTSATLRDVLTDMLNKSGNTAVRIMVNNALGGAVKANERLALKPQLSHTRLQPLDANRFYLGNSTPHDSLWALDQMMRKQDKYAKFMKDAMSTNIFEDFGVRSQLADSEYILLANKIGTLDDVEGNNRHDVGIIYNKKTKKSYGYSLFTTAPYNETDPVATTQADQSLKDMGRSMLRFAGSRKTYDYVGNGEWRKHIERRVNY
jgi:beta-lactamase class A